MARARPSAWRHSSKAASSSTAAKAQPTAPRRFSCAPTFPTHGAHSSSWTRTRPAFTARTKPRLLPRLPPLPEAAAAHICHLVLMQLVPGLKESDIDAFGCALTEIQAIVGGHFAAAQGGSPWTSPAVGRVVARCATSARRDRAELLGPDRLRVCRLRRNCQNASIILQSKSLKPTGLEILIAAGRNRGASIETHREHIVKNERSKK